MLDIPVDQQRSTHSAVYAESRGDTQVRFLDEVVDTPVVADPISLMSFFWDAQSGVHTTHHRSLRRMNAEIADFGSGT